MYGALGARLGGSKPFCSRTSTHSSSQITVFRSYVQSFYPPVNGTYDYLLHFVLSGTISCSSYCSTHTIYSRPQTRGT